jgi:hypothetical protein
VISSLKKLEIKSFIFEKRANKTKYIQHKIELLLIKKKSYLTGKNVDKTFQIADTFNRCFK